MQPEPVQVARCECGSSNFKITAFETAEGAGLGCVQIDGHGMIVAMSGIFACFSCDKPVVLPQDVGGAGPGELAAAVARHPSRRPERHLKVVS